MPVIAIHSLELAAEQKKRIAAEFTRIFSEETHVPEEKIYLFFTNYDVNSISVGGALLATRVPPFAKFKQTEIERTEGQ